MTLLFSKRKSWWVIFCFSFLTYPRLSVSNLTIQSAVIDIMFVQILWKSVTFNLPKKNRTIVSPVLTYMLNSVLAEKKVGLKKFGPRYYIMINIIILLLSLSSYAPLLTMLLPLVILQTEKIMKWQIKAKLKPSSVNLSSIKWHCLRSKKINRWKS